ncbi:exosome complex component RRP42-like [Cucumis melo var. makuwa]|uniref:Exosome complex component RRP42-like n=1 Tax=Cucumis melo var. makuwa TaxID=1194695 RepID=A0A5D3C8N4_CUCMM|nr:exosome complex component RRP42-like [Cucumis melo var. makuwa]
MEHLVALEWYLLGGKSASGAGINLSSSIVVEGKLWRGYHPAHGKGGGVGVDPSIIFEMISVGKNVSEELLNKLNSDIVVAEADEDE